MLGCITLETICKGFEVILHPYLALDSSVFKWTQKAVENPNSVEKIINKKLSGKHIELFSLRI